MSAHRFEKGNKHGFKKGKSGNPLGRPRRPEIEVFRQALSKVEKEKGKALIVHAIRKAYEDKDVLIALIRKMVPDISSIELKGNMTLQSFMAVLRDVHTVDSNKVVDAELIEEDNDGT